MANYTVENNAPPRTGYEIREGLLGLAQNIVSENMHMRFETASDADKATFKGYTTEDVIETAEKLYTFVQQK